MTYWSVQYCTISLCPLFCWLFSLSSWIPVKFRACTVHYGISVTKLQYTKKRHHYLLSIKLVIHIEIKVFLGHSHCEYHHLGLACSAFCVFVLKKNFYILSQASISLLNSLFVQHTYTRVILTSPAMSLWLFPSSDHCAVVRCLHVPLADLFCSSALFGNMNPALPVTAVFLCKCRGGQIVAGLACPWPFVLSPFGPPSRDRPCVQVETLPSTLLAG